MSKKDSYVRLQRKLKAIVRAERSLRRRIEDIDFDIDVLAPALDDVKDLVALGKLPNLALTDGGGVLQQIQEAVKEEQG